MKHSDAVEVWRGERECPLPDGGRWVDGYTLRRVWLGPRRSAIGFVPRRIYLDDAGARDRRPEQDIVSKRPAPREDTRQTLSLFLDQLQDAADGFLGPAVRVEIGEGLLERVTLHGGNRSFPWNTRLRTVHEQAAFFRAPSNLEIRLCADEGVGGEILTHYGQLFEDEVEKREASPTVKCVTLAGLLKRLEELDAGKPPKRGDVPILFMLADEERSPSARLKKAWTLMDRHRLPWRRAYANDNRTWSVADQVGSLLQGAGGLPHAVRLDGDESLPWSIGVDVSHRKTFSRTAAALITPDGRLSGAWTVDGPRKEDIPRGTLRRLLEHAARGIPEAEPASGILVVRDGRKLEPEDADDYRCDLGAPVTLVEFRKRNNPPLLLDDAGAQPSDPVVGWVPEARNESLGFAVLSEPSDASAFAKVAKLRMKKEWDGMHLGPQGLARVLAAQTLTPGLGLRKRMLPAPIYWSDGIAGASDADLRFRGQAAIPLDQV